MDRRLNICYGYLLLGRIKIKSIWIKLKCKIRPSPALRGGAGGSQHQGRNNNHNHSHNNNKQNKNNTGGVPRRNRSRSGQSGRQYPASRPQPANFSTPNTPAPVAGTPVAATPPKVPVRSANPPPKDQPAAYIAWLKSATVAFSVALLHDLLDILHTTVFPTNFFFAALVGAVIPDGADIGSGFIPNNTKKKGNKFSVAVYSGKNKVDHIVVEPVVVR
jgi:hypothetical protein